MQLEEADLPQKSTGFEPKSGHTPIFAPMSYRREVNICIYIYIFTCIYLLVPCVCVSKISRKSRSGPLWYDTRPPPVRSRPAPPRPAHAHKMRPRWQSAHAGAAVGRAGSEQRGAERSGAGSVRRGEPVGGRDGRQEGGCCEGRSSPV